MRPLHKLIVLVCAVASGQTNPPSQTNGLGLAGYISAAIPAPPSGYSDGVSFYSTAWPLLQQPISNFQIGLPSTWIIPSNAGYSGAGQLCPPWTTAYQAGWLAQRGGSFADVFQTIEGGMGFWGSTRFPSAVPKYRINGTPDCYTTEISSPGWGFGSTTALPDNKTGLVQVSNRILIPPDGLNFDPATNGQVFGVAWMSMPMTDLKLYYYQLRSQFLDSKNYCLDSNLADPSLPFGGSAYMAPCGSDEQLWKMVPAASGSGYFQLMSRATEDLNLCLEGNTGKGSEPHRGAAYMAACSDSPGQLWTFTRPLSSAWSRLQTKQSQALNLCLEGNNGLSTGSLNGAAFMVTCGTSSGTNWTSNVQQAGSELPVGNKSWTLYVNSTNFKGPVAYYVPDVWTDVAVGNPPAVGRGLDTRPGTAGSGAMEVNSVPFIMATDSTGTVFTRVPRLRFPVDSDGNTVLMQDFTLYSPDSWFQPMSAWFQNGGVPPTAFDPAASWTPVRCTANPLAFTQWVSGKDNTPLTLTGFADVVSTAVHNGDTCSWGLKWTGAQEMTDDGMAVFPEYYKQTGTSRSVVPASSVPRSTLLTLANFNPAPKPISYNPPKTGTAWTSPGAVAGPFQATLSDGSIATYSWYRFVDQPALQRFNLSDDAKAQLQQRVELLQANSPIDQDYLTPPSRGDLATLDGGMLVLPPSGFEIGYVPIVTRQDPQPPMSADWLQFEAKTSSHTNRKN